MKSKCLILPTLLLVPMTAIADCNLINLADAPSKNSFQVIKEVVVDQELELQWTRCSVGQFFDGGTCIGEASTHEWQDAVKKANAAQVSGHDDWRLPTLSELRHLTKLACKEPTFVGELFPAASAGYYWTQTPFTFFSGINWQVFFDVSSNSSVKESEYHVRLVRG